MNSPMTGHPPGCTCAVHLAYRKKADELKRRKNKPSIRERARAVIDARTDDFVELIKHAGLDPVRGDLRFSNWSNISFAGCDLRRFDFSGARLNGCTFKDAQIEGARFDGADLKNAALRTAVDWDKYAANWVQPSEKLNCRHLNSGAIFQDLPFAPEMAVIPPGSFYMGSPDGSGGEQGDIAEWGRTRDEGRRRKIEIDLRFAIGRFAVTRDEFAKFIAATKHEMPTAMETYEYRKTETRPGRDWRSPGFTQKGDHPVVAVRWSDAVAYCEWLSELVKQEYRLPSEVEWEYAARAGTDTPFWWGHTIDWGNACYDGTQKYGSSGPSYGSKSDRTEPVDKYDPNPWGLYQVHGNVWEWCDNSYESGTRFVVDQRKRDPTSKAVRGGSWRTLGRNCRSANRSFGDKHQNRHRLQSFTFAVKPGGCRVAFAAEGVMAMGAGTDVAMESDGVTLMRETSVDRAGTQAFASTMSNIRQSLCQSKCGRSESLHGNTERQIPRCGFFIDCAQKVAKRSS